MKERLARFGLRLLEAIPLPVLAFLFESAMQIVWAIDGKHRRIARINLRIAFPEMEDKEARRIIRNCYKRIGTTAAEFIYIPKIDERYLREHLRMEGLEHIKKSEAEGRPILIMTGHFGNWEFSSFAYGILVKPMAFIVKTLRSPILDAIVTERRQLRGNTVIRQTESAKQVIRFLRNKVMIGILIDQNVDQHKGVLVELFGRKTYTTDGIARLALALNAAIHPGFLFRDPANKFRHILWFGPAVHINYDASKEEEIPEITRRCNQELEKAIIRAPDHWMWFQARWKNRGKGERDVYMEEP